MVQGFRGWFLDQLAMYVAYHRDRRNRFTHHIGVPLIVLSVLIALMRIPLTTVEDVPITAATVVLSILLLAYVIAVPFIGIPAVILYGFFYGIAQVIASGDAVVLWSVAIGGFVVGWVMQFIGHSFEGRRPALTVNILQIFMAPAFLIAEALFAVGQQKELESTLEARAVKYQPQKLMP